MKQATDSRSLPAKPAFPSSSAGPCASCGGPLTDAGSGVLRHRLTGTVSCRPALDPDDGGWCEPNGWHLGPVATAALGPLAAARVLAGLADRYEAQATAGGRRAGARSHAAQGLRVLAVHLCLSARDGAA